MSRNMSQRINNGDWHGHGQSGSLAVGMQATNTCVNCGMTKASKAHKLVADRCSRALQKKYASEG